MPLARFRLHSDFAIQASSRGASYSNRRTHERATGKPAFVSASRSAATNSAARTGAGRTPTGSGSNDKFSKPTSSQAQERGRLQSCLFFLTQIPAQPLEKPRHIEARYIEARYSIASKAVVKPVSRGGRRSRSDCFKLKSLPVKRFSSAGREAAVHAARHGCGIGGELLDPGKHLRALRRRELDKGLPQPQTLRGFARGVPELGADFRNRWAVFHLAPFFGNVRRQEPSRPALQWKVCQGTTARARLSRNIPVI